MDTYHAAHWSSPSSTDNGRYSCRDIERVTLCRWLHCKFMRCWRGLTCDNNCKVNADYCRHGPLQVDDQLSWTKNKMGGEYDNWPPLDARNTRGSPQKFRLSVETGNRLLCVWPQAATDHSKAKGKHKEKCSAVACTYLWLSWLLDPPQHQDQVHVPGNVGEGTQLGRRVTTWSDTRMATVVFRTNSATPVCHTKVVQNRHAATD